MVCWKYVTNLSHILIYNQSNTDKFFWINLRDALVAFFVFNGRITLKQVSVSAALMIMRRSDLTASIIIFVSVSTRLLPTFLGCHLCFYTMLSPVTIIRWSSYFQTSIDFKWRTKTRFISVLLWLFRRNVNQSEWRGIFCCILVMKTPRLSLSRLIWDVFFITFSLYESKTMNSCLTLPLCLQNSKNLLA